MNFSFLPSFVVFSVIFLSSSVMFLLPCFSVWVILVSWNDNWLPDRPTQRFAIYFCLSPVEKGQEIPSLPREESISDTEAAAASRQGCTILIYITYSLSATRHLDRLLPVIIFLGKKESIQCLQSSAFYFNSWNYISYPEKSSRKIIWIQTENFTV